MPEQALSSVCYLSGCSQSDVWYCIFSVPMAETLRWSHHRPRLCLLVPGDHKHTYEFESNHPAIAVSQNDSLIWCALVPILSLLFSFPGRARSVIVCSLPDVTGVHDMTCQTEECPHNVRWTTHLVCFQLYVRHFGGRINC